MAMVRCEECGWCGVRLPHVREIGEYSETIRSAGAVLVGNEFYTLMLLCYAGEVDFWKVNQEGHNQASEAAKDRECSQFTPRRPGKTPLELEQMIHQESMLALHRSSIEIQSQLAKLQEKITTIEREKLQQGEASGRSYVRWTAIQVAVMIGMPIISAGIAAAVSLAIHFWGGR